MTPLKSSVIKSADYDASAKRLTVDFHSGQSYTYDGVPDEIARGLVQAESAGKFFHETIRNNYATAKVEEDQD